MVKPFVRRSFLGSALAAAAAATVAGCSGSTDTAEDAAGGSAASDGAGKITLTDQRGTQIELDAPAQKIVSAVIPAPAIIAAVDGSWDRIVGINQSTLDANKVGIIKKIYPDSVKTPVIASRDFTPNMEEILATDPDLVVQWGDRGDDITAPIEQAGYPIVGLEYGTQEFLEKWISMFGTAIGKDDRAKDIIDWMHSEADAVSKQVKKLDEGSPRMLSLSYSDQALSVSTGTDYIQYVCDLTGLTNVAKDAKVADGVATVEQILDWDPEIIFLSAFDPATPDDVYADDRLSEVSAVRDKRVYRAPLGVYRWQVPCAESPLFWNWVAALGYPGKYEIDLPTEMKKQTTYLYNYDLSDEDVELVLRNDINAGSADYDVVSR